jgi:hypothetical protein
MIIRMASKRSVRKRACRGKVRHTSLANASMALRVSKATGNYRGPMHAYKCVACSFYHIGHFNDKWNQGWQGKYNKREWHGNG